MRRVLFYLVEAAHVRNDVQKPISFLAQCFGWRWIFWFLTILSRFVLILYLLFMPETRPFHRTFWQLGQDAYRKRKVKRDTDGLPVEQKSTKKNLKIQQPNLARTLLIPFERDVPII